MPIHVGMNLERRLLPKRKVEPRVKNFEKYNIFSRIKQNLQLNLILLSSFPPAKCMVILRHYNLNG